jgi:hypothetical protein
MTEKVDFRYSDIDFISYLVTIGYEYTHIEVVRDNRTNKLKGYVHFFEDKNELMSIFEDYKNEILTGNIVQLRDTRKKIHKFIKSEILKYQAERL